MRQAIILVGGMGTRLGELTRDKPKPMLPVAGKPFLHWLIDRLRTQGVGPIILAAGYRSEHVQKLADELDNVSVVVEPTPLGTGGALRFCLDQLEDRFLMLNGDSWVDSDVRLLERPACDRVLGRLTLCAVEDVSRFGSVELEGERITRFAGRRDGAGPGLINAGISLLERAMVEAIPLGRSVSLEREILPDLAEEGRLRGLPVDGEFIDIGVPEDYQRAQEIVPSILGRGDGFAEGSR